MPKKTKKQKLLADLRRKINSLPNVPTIQSQRPEVNSVKRENEPSRITHPIYSYDKNPVDKKSFIEPKTAISASDYSYIKHDLIKITIFTFLALIFQSVIYFVLNRG